MKKVISVVLIIIIICLNLSTTVLAEDNKILNKFKEYNNKKIRLYMSAVELYKSGWGLS